MPCRGAMSGDADIAHLAGCEYSVMDKSNGMGVTTVQCSELPPLPSPLPSTPPPRKTPPGVDKCGGTPLAVNSQESFFVRS